MFLHENRRGDHIKWYKYFKWKAIFAVWNLSKLGVLTGSGYERKYKTAFATFWGTLKHYIPICRDLDETEVIVEDLLMPSKNEHQQLFMFFKFPQGKLNSRNDGMDQLVHICGDKGDLLDPDLF